MPNKMKIVGISMPPPLENYAKEKAARNYESLAAYVRRLILEDQQRETA